MLQVYLLELYIVAGLDPFLAGLALAIAVVWDAVSDPLMGWISDRTRSDTAVGKRMPYFFTGTVLMGIAFALLFQPGSGWSSGMLFFYLLALYLLLNTALTLVGVPHLAIINDLASTQAGRADFFSWRLVFGGIGLLLGLSIPVFIASALGQEGVETVPALLMENRSHAGWWIGGLSVFFGFFTGIVVWKPLKRVHCESLKQMGTVLSIGQLGRPFRSRLFRIVVFAFACIALGRSFNSSLALLFYKFRLGFSEQQIAILLLVLTVVIIIAVPGWLKLSRRFEKRSLCLVGTTLLALLTAVVYPLLPPGILWPVLLVAAAGGVLVACVALLESMFSDVVERDQTHRSEPLTGAYYGLWKMATKVARALGLVLSGWYLSIIGFVEGSPVQTPEVQWALAWAFGPGVAVFFGLGALCVYKFRMQVSASAE